MIRSLPLIAGLVLFPAAASAERPPVVLPSQYVAPTDDGLMSEDWPRKAPTPACRLRVTEVTDPRADPESMGEIEGRPIHAVDAKAWLRSGLEFEPKGSRVKIVGDADEADLELKATLLKAYVLTQPETKAVNIVVRVSYSRHGAPLDEKVYRGGVTEMNWSGGEGEARQALNGALAKLLDQVNADILSQCAQPQTGHASGNSH
jgi:hypothetical protein